jgi:hypothetical protein
MIRVIDLETENHEYLGAKASPHCEQNYIVMAAWQDYDWAGQKLGGMPCVEFDSREQAESEPWFNLDGVQFLVAHNAMFENSWFLTRYRDEFVKFMQRGGRVLCTQLAEYLLSHQTNLYPSLDETAPKYGGTQKVDGVKVLWEQGYLTSQIDRDLLREYLAGPGGDIENTAKVFFGQRSMLQRAGMFNMYLERCEGMTAYSLCEWAGMYVNLEVAERNLAEHTAELEGIEAQVSDLLPELPETFEFNWGSLHMVSAFIYGGPIKYKVKVPYEPKQYVKADYYSFGDKFLPVSEVQTAEQFQAAVLAHGDCDKYKSGKNKGLPKVHRLDTAEEKLKWGEAVFQFPGLIKISDLPVLIQENFHKDKGDWVSKLTLVDGSPVYSTSGEVLELLATQGFESADLLRRRAALAKDIGTYYRKHEYDKDGNIKETKGMLQYVGADGIIHHNLNITATVTARLSSSDPNLQNLPRDGTSRVKQMFTSRFGEDGVIVECDYTALEVVMLASLSKDQNLLDKLLDGTDMHLYRLAGKRNDWQGHDYDALLAILHDKQHPMHKVVKEARTNIKPRAFAAQYGATARGIAYATGCTLDEAAEFLENEAALFPASIAFRDVVYDAVCKTGEKNLCREQTDDGRWSVYHRGYYQAPGGTCYSFREYPQRRGGELIMDYKPTQIANYWCQGEAGFLMTITAGRVMRWLLSKNFFVNEAFPLGRAFLTNHVHDALYLDVHKSVLDQVALPVKAVFEDTPKYMSRLGYDIADVPFPAVVEAGPSMYEKSEVVNE